MSTEIPIGNLLGIQTVIYESLEKEFFQQHSFNRKRDKSFAGVAIPHPLSKPLSWN